jgi:uncharacterized protein
LYIPPEGGSFTLSWIKNAVLKLRGLMLEKNMNFDGAILFGSFAKGTNHSESDVDLAILSQDFGKDRISEGVLLQTLIYPYLTNVDIIPISSYDFVNPNSVSPLLAEIKKNGICLL